MMLVAGDTLRRLIPSDFEQLFDDDGDGRADAMRVAESCEDASAFATRLLLSGWPSEDAIAEVARDPSVQREIGWIALHFRAQGKAALRGPDGKAQYWVEAESAEKHLKELAKAQLHTPRESDAGANRAARGHVSRPREFVLAESRTQRKAPGGY